MNVEGAESGSVPNENIADTRVRRLTEKGQEEKIRRLKNDQTAKISAVSKQASFSEIRGYCFEHIIQRVSRST